MPATGARKAETKRVACIGDSITYGTGIEGRLWNSYPSQLAGLLGRGWDVRNFGVNNATALEKGFLPYRQTQTFKDALEFLPHIVVIKLGTNDARTLNWRHKDEFEGDYIALIGCFQRLESRPKIWLCTPAPVFRGKGGRPEPTIQNEIVPRIREIARRTGLPVIDLNSTLLPRRDFFPDGVHPDERGAGVIAEAVFDALAGRR